MITIDTLRPDRVSCYNKSYLQTPNIDIIGKKGVIFTRAFAHTPTTLPSHANILLGLTPLSHGVHDNSHFKVDEEFLTLSEHLKKYGYSTGAFVGAFPLDSRFGLDQGFDIYDDSYPSKPKHQFIFPERRAEKVIGSAINWLSLQRNKWFAWIHLFDPHQPYNPPSPFRTKFGRDLYSGEVAYVDSELGRLFEYLKRKDHLKNTIIILTGDHGESLGEHGESTHGYFAYNSTLWVPLIISGPGINPELIDKMVSHIDIFPTICDLLEVDKPPLLQGVSLIPLIKGKKLKEREIYFESLHAYYNRGWAPVRGFIDGKYKYIDSPIPELYNLKNDFNERTNIASQVNISSFKEKLREIELKFSSQIESRKFQRVDKETLEKLKSLGYISNPIPQLKRRYGPEDDLKTLLPLHNKFQRAILLYEKGRVNEGINLLSEVINQRKDFDLAYCRLAEIYKSEGRANEALEIMREGYKNNPGNHSIISAYGIMLAETGRMEEAVKILQKGVELFSFDPELWNYLGIAYWKKGESKKAFDAYKKSLSLDKNYAMVYNNLGSLYLSLFVSDSKMETGKQSIIYFKKAIELDPELASAYNGLGGVYKKLRKIEEAIEFWKKALELDPNFDFPAYNLGVTYLEKGKKEIALVYFQQYLRIRNKNLTPEERKKIESIIQKCK